jgi:hypothetical protein
MWTTALSQTSDVDDNTESDSTKLMTALSQTP